MLCLNTTIPPTTLTSSPSLDECKLCYVNRDTLFSYHKDSERFLQKLIAILVASHYKNSPNDLQIMSDAPAHHIFCLCAPSGENESKAKEMALPEVLCVLQVCLEGKISEKTVKHELSRGKRGAGDLIPWVISQEFDQENFPSLSGARIVRIATHPDYQGKGYGLLTLKLLQDFYEEKFYVKEDLSSVTMNPVVYDDTEIMDVDMEEKLESQASLPALLPPLNKLRPDRLDYLGVSYGLSQELLRF
ncbi:RNA cytidine acetyltransferase [Caerostris extrusa]|uniref:RNA cytidine acetyltransferase n=1 Tax=Caerostris extrusa TaxID=172846 RepID=A0AAV4Y7T2_CAEEX|nr:RNA cytidine acetyltransferase [Caerostris extrusa]